MTTSTGKTNLLGLTQPEMEKFFDSIGEKRFRAGQVMKWIHHFGVDDFDAMTNVGKALREKLKAVAEIRGPEVVSEDISSDGTRKWVVRVASGSCVETVYIPQGKRGTLCVSSQAGCALDCSPSALWPAAWRCLGGAGGVGRLHGQLPVHRRQ
ncbi:hypothetical protein ACQKQA_29880, partial [Pseudomonas sp. NPDC089530]